MQKTPSALSWCRELLTLVVPGVQSVRPRDLISLGVHSQLRSFWSLIFVLFFWQLAGMRMAGPERVLVERRQHSCACVLRSPGG